MKERSIVRVTATAMLYGTLMLLISQRDDAGFAQQPEQKMSDNPTKKESPFACNMKALTPEQRKQHLALIKRLFAVKQEMRELPNGYAFRYDADSVKIQELAEFISNEKLCCSFFDFALKVEREDGPLWLELTGRAGVKAFIRLEFGF